MNWLDLITADMSYLELGLGSSKTFDAVKTKDKVSVDIAFEPTFKMSTDEFFAQNKRRFDVIYIDACHEIRQVIKDYNNTIKICNKFIVMHDMYPPNVEYATPDFCWDAYKLLAHFVEIKANYKLLKSDFGTVIIEHPFIEAENVDVKLSYEKFVNMHIKDLGTV